MQKKSNAMTQYAEVPNARTYLGAVRGPPNVTQKLKGSASCLDSGRHANADPPNKAGANKVGLGVGLVVVLLGSSVHAQTQAQLRMRMPSA
jgi:hypothetical protein